MSKNDVIKDVISKMEDEVTRVQCDIDELEKRKGRIHQKRILNNIRRGSNDNIVNM
jgi:hypothetical protein